MAYVKTKPGLSFKQFCYIHNIKNYKYSKGVLNVNGGVYLRGRGYEKIPYKFGIVKGDFICSYNKLTSLENAPTEVWGDFYCNHNNLETNYCDTKIKGDFITDKEEDGLVIKEYSNLATNYKEWQLNKQREFKLKKLLA